MKNLIIYAHPGNPGHCSTILEEVKKSLEERKIDYEVLDLYKDNYDSLLRKQEHFTAGNREINPENLTIQDKINKSDWLIFIYPVWWATMPAILKGFFDKVFTPRFAYKYEGPIPKKLLKGKKALVFMTSGSPLIYFWLTGNWPKRHIKKDILGFCGIKTKVVQIGNCRKFNEAKAIKIQKIVEQTIKNIF